MCHIYKISETSLQQDSKFGNISMGPDILCLKQPYFTQKETQWC